MVQSVAILVVETWVSAARDRIYCFEIFSLMALTTAGKQGKYEWRKQVYVAIDPPVCMECTYTLSMIKFSSYIQEQIPPKIFGKWLITRLNLEAK